MEKKYKPWATFESGEIVEFKMDFKTFDVSVEAYFNGDETYTAEEYEKIYRHVDEMCQKSSGYTIDFYQGRFTVRKNEEIRNDHYALKSVEEKAVYDEKILENTKKVLRIKRNQLLAETDKYMLPDYPIADSEREKYRLYRQYLRDLPMDKDFPDIEIQAVE